MRKLFIAAGLAVLVLFTAPISAAAPHEGPLVVDPIYDVYPAPGDYLAPPGSLTVKDAAELLSSSVCHQSVFAVERTQSGLPPAVPLRFPRQVRRKERGQSPALRAGAHLPSLRLPSQTCRPPKNQTRWRSGTADCAFSTAGNVFQTCRSLVGPAGHCPVMSRLGNAIRERRYETGRL